MPEEPEEVLPQDRIACGFGIEEMRAEEAVQQQHDLGGSKRRQGDQDLKATTQHIQTNRGIRARVIPRVRKHTSGALPAGPDQPK
jgi:hypothetical protein